MSDALLTEISKKLSDIHAALKGGASAGGAKNPTPAASPGQNSAGKTPAGAANRPSAAPGTAGKTPPAPAANTNKAAGATSAANVKAPGGKHTAEQVREIIKKVATNANLGKQAALNILDENAGVQNVSSVKPENFDAVYEACEVELNGVANAGGAAADADDPLA